VSRSLRIIHGDGKRQLGRAQSSAELGARAGSVSTQTDSVDESDSRPAGKTLTEFLLALV